jgi:hypothetical protein
MTSGQTWTPIRYSTASRSVSGAPAPARLEAQTAAQPTPEAPPAPAFDVDEFHRRRRERERAARFEELARRNAEAWLDQGRALRVGERLPKDAEWGGS